MKARHWLILILASLLLVACASSASGASSKAPPDGEYKVQNGAGGFFILALNQGRFTTSYTTSSTDPAPLAEGSYQINGDKITFHEEKLSDEAKSDCGSKTTYSYHWKFDSQTNLLTFSQDNDPCFERQDVHISGPFAYSPLK